MPEATDRPSPLGRGEEPATPCAGDGRVAAMDIGSNSVRLLVADCVGGQLFLVHTARIVSRLFEGLEGGVLDARYADKTLAAIAALADEAWRLGAARIYGFGTSALRDGWRSAPAFVDRAQALGVGVRVLSGREEADFAYAGAAPSGSAGVVDIGGGSTEFMSGRDGLLAASGSAQMGAVRLKALCGGALDGRALVERARSALEKAALEALALPPRDGWIGVGGTLSTLAAMEKGPGEGAPSGADGFCLPAAAVSRWLLRLCAMTEGQRRCVFGLPAGRADIMPFGAAIAAACFELIGCSHVTISERDNLWGFLQAQVLG